MNSSSRGKSGVRVLAVHTTEGIMRAADLRAWTAWAGSSHASADETGALLTPADGFVPYDRAAWTLLSGNAWSENIELCGLARWKRADWLARPLLLDACARWLADRSRARGIPLVKLSPAEYRAGKSGVIGHNDHTVGYSEGTHWDPGPDFPWDVVLGRARAYASPAVSGGSTPQQEDDMGIAIINLKPDEETVISRVADSMIVRAAIDQQRPGKSEPADQQVRAAQRIAGVWKPLYASGNTADPFQFWIGAGEAEPFTVVMDPAADKIVFRNMHPAWTLTLTVAAR